MINDPGVPRAARERPRRRHTPALAAAAAAVALLATACSSSPKPAAASSPPTYTQLLAYAQCMRTHGAPAYPDPVQGPGGYWAFLSTPGSEVNNPPAAAAKACQKLAPKNAPLPPSVIQAAREKLLELATCMRAHGITNFPDPVVGNGSIGISLHGLDPKSPQFLAAQQACQAYQVGPKTGGGR
jgi:hypothetical protein